MSTALVSLVMRGRSERQRQAARPRPGSRRRTRVSTERARPQPRESADAHTRRRRQRPAQSVLRGDGRRDPDDRRRERLSNPHRQRAALAPVAKPTRSRRFSSSVSTGSSSPDPWSPRVRWRRQRSRPPWSRSGALRRRSRSTRSTVTRQSAHASSSNTSPASAIAASATSTADRAPAPPHADRGTRPRCAKLGLGDHINVARGDFSESGGYNAADELLTLDPRPTAIFAANDLSCAGALDRVEDAGLQVPSELSIVGYDNTGLAAMHHLSLTTINQPRGEFGRIASGADPGATRWQPLDGSASCRRADAGRAANDRPSRGDFE